MAEAARLGLKLINQFLKPIAYLLSKWLRLPDRD